jgi:5-methylcytosine-specific restriction enzyme subunit McrC
MIQVREYALLTSDIDQQSSLDVGIVSTATFDWLLELQQRWRGDSELLALQSRNSLKLGSYVGYLQSPNGESIEVLPKTQRQLPNEVELTRSRVLLRSMLITALQLKPREADAALLQRMNTPLHEWIITEFLAQLSRLVNGGLRFDYEQVEEESRFIRGQMNQVKQSRQPPGRATWFHIRHDIYSPNRIENRLLKTALDFVLKITRDADNWRLANELAHQLSSIEVCAQPQNDLSSWRNGKLMQNYVSIKPWCGIIIEKLNPNFQKGSHKGIALMFPMELLFERYVAHCINGSLTEGSTLKTHAKSKYLIKHTPSAIKQEQKWFQLQPDLLILHRCMPSVLDTKWKLLDSRFSNSDKKYNLSQNDLYQLFAYGQNYLNGKGHMMLIYPLHAEFMEPLPKFSFDNRLHLWAVPFDCDTRQLIGGEWQQDFPTVKREQLVSNSMTG